MEKEKEKKCQGLIQEVKQYLKQQLTGDVGFNNLTVIGNVIVFVVFDDESSSRWSICLPIEELKKQTKKKDFENYITEQILNEVWKNRTVLEYEQ